jgi:SAM-dependent methyltransferase
MTNLEQYRAGELEQARSADLMRILPKGLRSVLDIGARDGYFSALLADHYQEVIALDLQRPAFSIPRVRTVAGDVSSLQFADRSFDCVFCAEVLEHVPDVTRACREIARVASGFVVVGVPFKQDLRLARTTCRSCGRAVPPWGHVNAFDEDRLSQLFPGFRVVSKSFIGSSNGATNALSALLMDIAGNPWGTYDQEEPCIHCGARLTPPVALGPWAKGCCFVASALNRIQQRCTPHHGNWIHLVLSKAESTG